MSFARLDTLCRSLDALDHALAILGADEATHMAVGGGASRAAEPGHATRIAPRPLVDRAATRRGSGWEAGPGPAPAGPRAAAA